MTDIPTTEELTGAADSGTAKQYFSDWLDIATLVWGRIEEAVTDDGVMSWTPNAVVGEAVIQVRNGAASQFAHVGFCVDAGGAALADLGKTSDVELATGALTGTTGTDAKVTVSAHTDGKIYVENRLGSALDIVYREIGAL